MFIRIKGNFCYFNWNTSIVSIVLASLHTLAYDTEKLMMFLISIVEQFIKFLVIQESI